MKTVYKYPLLDKTDIRSASIPRNAKVVHAGMQGDDLCIWAEIDTDEKILHKRYFSVFGTGMEVRGHHVTTFMMGPYVWHLYELLELT
jgi:hypothetical protein